MRLLLALAALIVISYLLWTLLLKLLGVSAVVERAGAFLAVEDRGTVNITIDGKQQRAEDGMMVFSGESVSTSKGAHASLQFFDASRVRLADGTDLGVTESSRGKQGSRVSLDLRQGSLWVATSGARSFTGSVAWAISSPTLDFTVAQGTEAELSPTSVTVFSSDGDGVIVTLKGHDPFQISEGQQWMLPASGQVGNNIYDHRSPLDPLAARSSFVVVSRSMLQASLIKPPTPNTSAELLTLAAPANGAVITTPTVIVQGTVGPGVTRVMVNGYPVLLDTVKRSFSQEVSPSEGQGDFEIAVQAQDDARTILAEAHRTVKRGPPAPLSPPAITAPARTGDTYGTQAEELILRGTAPPGTAGIMVNDYKLQLFEPTKGEWSYVASLRLKNMVPGTNTYDVYAMSASGKKSDAARLTIIQGGDGPTGVIATASSSSSAASVSPGTLPTNTPTLPGTLLVTAPEAGLTHTETGTGFLLEGTTSARTASIWVNDYKLQLYKSGKTTWNYIVDVAFNNLKKGKNTYEVTARGSDEQILDTLTYTVEYQPE